MTEPTTPPTPFTLPAPALPAGPAARPALRRARTERMLFGVCGGIAKSFGLDPTLVRVGFVLVALFPPAGGTLLLAYAAMAVIVPQEDAEPLAGTSQARENLASLRRELVDLAGTIRAKVTGEPYSNPPGTPAGAPDGATGTAPLGRADGR